MPFLEVRLELTPEVYTSVGSFKCDKLQASVPLDKTHLALELGLISERISVLGSSASAPFLWPFAKRARWLPRSASRALIASVAHNAQGMVLAITTSMGICTWAFVESNVGLGTVAVGSSLGLLSILVHEAGHAVAFRLLSQPGTPAILVNSGLRCHLVRRPLTRKRELAVVLAGPLAPLLTSPALLASWSLAPPLVIGWLILAAGHAVSVVVPVGDGANFWTALRYR